MDKLTNLLLKENKYQLVLVILFILYILLDVKTPENLAYLFDNMYGQLFLILGALAIFLNSHPVVGPKIDSKRIPQRYQQSPTLVALLAWFLI